ncbi:MAG: UDP-N-acetylmuramoyl-L-alanyl-D-glutamate--2,6-diaminopimelate ligase [Bacteroidia bacterium]|nr:UDP-N-acetylmuramoyl-L-alanyl-D-glutamate--2,6-diaminopimelate ligase [Bacteroidia bacterium]MDW8134349.1 UDP-N-acetylmuramoyl-L-alanyl-D-glutamate--2,6-diaminopimelate ligase [Bacteroidia bacterium]
MKPLEKLIEGVSDLHVNGPISDILIKHLTADSRQVFPGSLFVAWQGRQVDGHAFIPEAIAKGAVAILAEKPVELPPSIPLIYTSNARKAYARLCSKWFGNPEREVSCVGITGTNGKSSTTYYLYQLWKGLGYKAGLIGTVFCLADGEQLPATLTTPDSYELYRLLRYYADKGISHVAMEVSSIALDQYRTEGIPFRGAVFTNLSHDHLDYHGTFLAYRDAKKRLFDELPPRSFALTNADDRNGLIMLQNTAACTFRYSLQQVADFYLTLRETGLWGLSYELNIHLSEIRDCFSLRYPLTDKITDLHAPLIGHFQAYNLLAAVGAAFLSEKVFHEKEGKELWQKLSVLSTTVQTLPGRLEPVPLGGGRIGLVDYAHTPDAVEKVLRSLRSLLPEGGKLVAVLGAGGNRDRTKRGPMGIAAAKQADLAILTSDNPRDEDPLNILKEMLEPIPADLRKKVLCIPDRTEAIKSALHATPPNSLVVVLGKGHETYQEIRGVRYPFSDKEVLEKWGGLLYAK